MIGMEFKKVLADFVTSVTLVGYITDSYPSPRGNCFSVKGQNGQSYRILNFNHENLEELMRRDIIEWPIMIHELEPGYAVVADARIPDEWYDTKFCNTCTPRNLLPYPQLLRIELEIMRGNRTEREVEINGKKHIMVSINVKSESRPVRAPYTIDTTTQVVK